MLQEPGHKQLATQADIFRHPKPVPNRKIQRELARKGEHRATAQDREFHQGHIILYEEQGLTKRQGILSTQKLENQLLAAPDS